MLKDKEHGLLRLVDPNPPTVLLLADDPQIVRTVQALLTKPAVAVSTAESAAGALAQLQIQDVALALIDLRLPDMEGYAVAQAMRGSAHTRHLPIIFLMPGGHRAPDRVHPLDGDDAAAFDILYKPLDAAVLTAKVKVFGDLHRQRRLLAQRLSEAHRAAQRHALTQAALLHDIRTHLASLMLNAEVVLRRAASPGVHQAGERIKRAAAATGRRVDHLANLSQLPSDSLRPTMAHGDLRTLVAGCVQAAGEARPDCPAITLTADGPSRTVFDATLLAQAVDQLLLLSASHSQGQPVTVSIEGRADLAVMLQVAFAAVLAEELQLRLFGGGPAIRGMPASLGLGLAAAARITRAHGGSLIGRSREPDGTWFELMLPHTGPG